MTNEKSSFVIRCNSKPVRLLYTDQQHISAYNRRLQSRYAKQTWSVSARFPLYGTD